ncbi:MAG: hypothetical protein E6Q97_20300 [Desulfurellales bacterium]|nr:MAG: hypothetical protein E6Q97_20300 [Desulfurellales bacterium]
MKSAIKYWTEKYGSGPFYDHRGRKKFIGKWLMKLNPETATAADVVGIIGCKSWAKKHTCYECSREAWDMVEIGDEGVPVCICGDCLHKALRLLEETMARTTEG